MITHAEEAHPPGRQQLLVEHVSVVGRNLGGTRTLIKAGVRSLVIDPVAS